MNYENIPQYIKDFGQFCCWRLEKRKGRMTKVPYNPVTKQRASVDKENTFVNYHSAVNRLLRLCRIFQGNKIP